MKILLIEDDERIARPLAEELTHQRHVVDTAFDGAKGWEYATSVAYDLILLDLMLPKIDGITICKRLRSAKYKALILMLTARDTITDKVIGLDAGADDYLVKPFELEELAARIRALSRRARDIQSPTLNYGKLQIDPSQCDVTYQGNLLSLTPKEYMILEIFLRNPNHVFSRAVLLDKLWEVDGSSGEDTIKTHITNLRRKLRSSGCQEDVIETIYGIGYRLNKIFNV
ncbi:DNA-binding response regulator [Nostoc sp. RF31YmG]|nr:DNA-binding response regulator [Nostoc sp. RF31YmG]